MTTRTADKTVESLEKKYRKSPGSRVFSRLADALLKEGNVNRAIELCIDGTKIHPDYVTGHLVLGRCFLKLQNFNDAIDEFRKVCTIDRHNHSAMKMLADIFVQQKMDQKAGNLYAILSNMDPYNKSLQKLASQYPSDGITELFDILDIQYHSEPLITGNTSIQQEVMDDGTVAYAEPDSESIGGDSSLEQTLDDYQQISYGFSDDQQDQAGTDDSGTINLQAYQSPGEDSDQDNSFQFLNPDNEIAEHDQIFSSSDIDPEASLVESTDITGQDISSRIDELFSEPSGIPDNLNDRSVTELVVDDDAPETIDLGIYEKTASIDSSVIVPELDIGQQQTGPDLTMEQQEGPDLIIDQQDGPDLIMERQDDTPAMEQQPDLILEQPRPAESVDSFTEKNPFSEFEETMQFDRSFLDNVLDGKEAGNDADLSAASQSLMDQDLIAEEPGGQEVSMDRSTTDAFDPSKLISEETGENRSSDPKSRTGDSTDSFISTDNISDLIQQTSAYFPSPEQDSAEPLNLEQDLIIDPDVMPEVELKEEELPEQLFDTDGVELIKDPDPDDSLPGIEIISEDDGMLSIAGHLENPDFEPVQESDSGQLTGEALMDQLIVDDDGGSSGIELGILNNDLSDPAIIDMENGAPEFDQVNVDLAENVLTDMDVLVSDEVLGSVSGDDIVEKMEMLFPDENRASGSNPPENIPPVQEQIPADNDENTLDIINTGSPVEYTEEDEGYVKEDEDEQGTDSIISGQDVRDRLDQFFPGDDLINNGSALIPPDNADEEEGPADFYTIFGDNAEKESLFDHPGSLDQLNLNTISEPEKPVSFFDEWNDVCNLHDQNESSAFKENMQKGTEKSIKQNITFDHPEADKNEETPLRPYTIPDHVLTPTLADIYFQQGQPDLAIQIYTRLLSRDPDNENLQQRLKQLKESADSGLDNTGNQGTHRPKAAASPSKKRKTVVDNRPLAGVRLKRRKNNSGTKRSKNS